jgi:hypothetical protein
MLDDSPLVPYKRFLIGGSAMIRDATTQEWHSLGTVYSASRSPVTEIKRIEGAFFTNREDAIKAGLDLAKQWVDELGSPGPAK